MPKPLRNFATQKLLDERLALLIASILKAEISQKGYANLGVSGGKTPKHLFKRLSLQEIPWENVNLTLVDERVVAAESKNSNQRMIQKHLLQNAASKANFISLNTGSMVNQLMLQQISTELKKQHIPPLDVCVLGMGEDGHTASLFPCAAEIEYAMAAYNQDILVNIHPETAPYERISFTLQALLQSKKVFLHLVGDKKLMTLQKAMTSDNELEMPIRAFLHRPEVITEIFWAPN